MKIKFSNKMCKNRAKAIMTLMFVFLLLSIVKTSYAGDRRFVEMLALQYEEEIKRDNKIVTWVDNIIAFQQTRDLLRKDLLVKKGLLIEILKVNGNDVNGTIEWVKGNIERESDLVEGLSVDVTLLMARMPFFRQTKEFLKKQLPEKENIVQVLRVSSEILVND